MRKTFVAVAALIMSIASVQTCASASQVEGADCIRARSAIGRDSVAHASSFESAACRGDEMLPAFRYDKAQGAAVLARNINAGEIVHRFVGYDAQAILPGDTLALVIGVGAVRIERQVEAMQAARPGQRLFVKSADGQILSVRYEGGER